MRIDWYGPMEARVIGGVGALVGEYAGGGRGVVVGESSGDVAKRDVGVAVTRDGATGTSLGAVGVGNVEFVLRSDVADDRDAEVVLDLVVVIVGARLVRDVDVDVDFLVLVVLVVVV
jgi:hypothetical protein